MYLSVFSDSLNSIRFLWLTFVPAAVKALFFRVPYVSLRQIGQYFKRFVSGSRGWRFYRLLKMMASQKVQYLRCAASLGISRTPMYAAFLGICDALILNFFLCHPKTDFLRVHQRYFRIWL